MFLEIETSTTLLRSEQALTLLCYTLLLLHTPFCFIFGTLYLKYNINYFVELL